MNSQDYKKSDVSIKKTFIWAAVFVVGIVAVITILNAFFISEMEKEVYNSVLKPESIELRDLRAREIETLTSYKVLDEQNKIVQIPIERAMQLLAEEAFTEQIKNSRQE